MYVRCTDSKVCPRGVCAFYLLSQWTPEAGHTPVDARAFLQAPLAPSPSLPPAGERGAQRHPALSFQGNIVVLVHGSEDGADEENELLGTALSHHSDLILWAEGLATGFCKDIHGEVMDQRGLQQGLLEPPAPCGCGGDVSVRSCPLETSRFCGMEGVYPAPGPAPR